MNPIVYMYIDGLVLAAFALNLWVLANEHPLLEPFYLRAVACITALGLFGHSLWMLADWIPSSAGVPFFRLVSDVGLMVLSSLFLAQLFRSKRREKQRLAGMAAIKNPNLDVTVRMR